MARRWLTGWRIILAVVALVVGTGKALVDIGVLNSKPGYGSLVIIGGGIVVFVDAIGRIIIANHQHKSSTMQADLDKAVQSTLKTVSEATGLDVWSLGGSVFVPRKAGLARRTLILDRVARVRLSDSPQATAVKWTPGKGVVGQVWEERRAKYQSWRKIAERYTADQLTPESFDRIREETRSGFTFAEFRGIVEKYAEIRAVPIWDTAQKTVIGVFSIDVSMTDKHPSLGNCLASQQAKETAERGAAVLSNVLRKR
ncbi:MAG: hypothetical protein J0J03_09665 [Leifsonia sp.]|nr:hypothetical protein [Leifsonia sp.]